MKTLFGLLPALFCVGGMFLCIRMMSGGHRGAANPTAAPQDDATEVAALRDEVARLRSEIDGGAAAPGADHRTN